MTNANKEALNATVHRSPVVKVVAIGVSGREASARMIKEGIKGVTFCVLRQSAS